VPITARISSKLNSYDSNGFSWLDGWLLMVTRGSNLGCIVSQLELQFS